MIPDHSSPTLSAAPDEDRIWRQTSGVRWRGFVAPAVAFMVVYGTIMLLWML